MELCVLLESEVCMFEGYSNYDDYKLCCGVDDDVKEPLDNDWLLHCSDDILEWYIKQFSEV